MPRFGALALPSTRVRRRALAAGCVGNLVEWYDFALYGACASIIAATFFPGPDPIGGLVATFSVYGVAFVARPVGALVFGHYGDHTGDLRAVIWYVMIATTLGAVCGMLAPETADVPI